jgi:hypothetical protein
MHNFNVKFDEICHDELIFDFLRFKVLPIWIKYEVDSSENYNKRENKKCLLPVDFMLNLNIFIAEGIFPFLEQVGSLLIFLSFPFFLC